MRAARLFLPTTAVGYTGTAGARGGIFMRLASLGGAVGRFVAAFFRRFALLTRAVCPVLRLLGMLGTGRPDTALRFFFGCLVVRLRIGVGINAYIGGHTMNLGAADLLDHAIFELAWHLN